MPPTFSKLGHNNNTVFHNGKALYNMNKQMGSSVLHQRSVGGVTA